MIGDNGPGLLDRSPVLCPTHPFDIRHLHLYLHQADQFITPCPFFLPITGPIGSALPPSVAPFRPPTQCYPLGELGSSAPSNAGSSGETGLGAG